MRVVYRDIAKHSAIYGLAHVLIRAASFLMLPVYTSYLRPADYGCMAILDVTANLLALVVGSGVAAAANRYHFEAEDEAERGRVWWTAQVSVALLALAIVAPAWLARGELARLTLGPEVPRGVLYFALILPTLWFSSVAEVGAAYVRARKWSASFMGLVVGRLVVNIGLNVYFLAVLKLGVAGLLLGNLIVAALNAAILVTVLAADRGRPAVHWPLLWRFAKFGGPLTASSLLVVLMNQADRYLLRIYLPLDQVGIYSLAYTLAEGVSSLFMAPFIQIWYAALFEIARQPGARRIYARVFEYYVSVLMLAMLGVSLGARAILGLLAARDFAGAADLVPPICLGYVFYSLNRHFEVPALLSKKTVSLLPAGIAAAAVNIAACLALIPTLGAAGAAWATVLTFAAYSSIGLWFYRRIDRYDYPLVRCAALLLGMCGTYVGWRLLADLGCGTAWQVAVAAAAWSAWAAVILLGPSRTLIPQVRAELARRLAAARDRDREADGAAPLAREARVPDG